MTFRALPGEFAGKPAHPLQVELLDRDGPVRNGSLSWSTSEESGMALPPDWPVELKPAGSWNTVEITVQDEWLRMSVNGKVALIADLGELADRPGANPALRRRSGRIGFQAHTGTVRFRNIAITELEGGESNSPGVAAGGAKTLTEAEAIDAYRALGKTLAAGRDWDKAAVAYREAIRLKPDDPATHLELAKILGQKGLREEATAEYREAIRLKPDDAATHFEFGNFLHDDSGAREAELAEFREAARLDTKGTPWARAELVWILTLSDVPRLRNPAEALEHARKAVEITRGQHPELPDDAGPGRVPLGPLRGGAGRPRQVQGVGRHGRRHHLVPPGHDPRAEGREGAGPPLVRQGGRLDEGPELPGHVPSPALDRSRRAARPARAGRPLTVR